MLYPSIDKLIQVSNSKYSIVILAARRGRDLLEKNNVQIEPRSQKLIGIALEEIASGKLYSEA